MRCSLRHLCASSESWMRAWHMSSRSCFCPDCVQHVQETLGVKRFIQILLKFQKWSVYLTVYSPNHAEIHKKQGSHYFERAMMKRARPVFKSHYSIMIFHWRGILYYLKLFKHTCSSIQVVCKIIQWFKRRGVTFEGQSGIFILSLTTCFPIGEGAWPLIWTTLIILQPR